MVRKIVFLLILVLVFTLTACAGSTVETAAVVNAAQNTNTALVEATAVSTAAGSVAEALAEKSKVHEDAEDYVWDSSTVVPIQLSGNSITVDGAGVTVDGSKATISSAGTYSISGSLEDGQIIVSTEDEDVVRLILNGVDVHSSTSAPIYVMNADETVIILAENTANAVTDGTAYVFETAEEQEPNAAIFSNSNLSIYGSGSLTVNGNFNDGISSDDGIVIASGTITINAADDGMRGKDYLVVKDGNITVNAQANGLKSDDEEDATKGYISIEAGIINITSAGDAIHAQTDVMVTGGEITLSSGGSSSSRLDGTSSAKGIKAAARVNIDGGTFTIDSADDAIHTNGSLTINGGTFQIKSGDDGMHADSTLEINDGDIKVAESYEGIESAVITINNGTIKIVSSDDGINVAGGNDGSGMQGPGGQDAFGSSGNYYLSINGGYVVVDAAGDGVDVNGAIEMTDGVVLVNGPTEQMNGALDYDVSFNITSGFFVAAGSSGMAMAPDPSSGQSSALIYFTAPQPAGSLVHIQNSAGEDILTFAPTKTYQSLTISSPKLVNGTTYEIFTGGSSTGSVNDGLYQDGSYASGTQYTSFTVSGTVTMVGSGVGGGGRGGRRP